MKVRCPNKEVNRELWRMMMWLEWLRRGRGEDNQTLVQTVGGAKRKNGSLFCDINMYVDTLLGYYSLCVQDHEQPAPLLTGDDPTFRSGSQTKPSQANKKGRSTVTKCI